MPTFPSLGINSVSRSEHLAHPSPFRGKKTKTTKQKKKNKPSHHHTKRHPKSLDPNSHLKPMANLLPLMVWKVKVQRTKPSLPYSPEATLSPRSNCICILKTEKSHSLGFKPFRISLEAAHFVNTQEVTFSSFILETAVEREEAKTPGVPTPQEKVLSSLS